MRGDEAIEVWKRLLPDDSTTFENKVAATSILDILRGRSIRKVSRSQKPLRFVLPTWDHQAPLKAVERAIGRTAFGEMLMVDGGHFDLFEGGLGFQKSLDGRLRLLSRVIGSDSPQVRRDD